MAFDDDARRAARDQLRLLGGKTGTYTPLGGGSPVSCLILVQLDFERGRYSRDGQLLAVEKVILVSVLDEEIPSSWKRGDRMTVDGATYEADELDADDGYLRTIVVRPWPA